jgi:hypothetical protein
VPEYFDNRGLTYAAMGDHDKATADYEQAIHMEQRASFFTDRGDSCQYKDELGTAPNDYRHRVAPRSEFRACLQ